MHTYVKECVWCEAKKDHNFVWVSYLSDVSIGTRRIKSTTDQTFEWFVVRAVKQNHILMQRHIDERNTI